MEFPKLYIIVNTASGAWLGNASQRNKTSAKLTKLAAPRLFTRRSAATQAMNAWMKGEHHYEFRYSQADGSGGYGEIVTVPVFIRQFAVLKVVEVDLVTPEDYIDVVYPV